MLENKANKIKTNRNDVEVNISCYFQLMKMPNFVLFVFIISIYFYFIVVSLVFIMRTSIDQNSRNV